MKISKSATGLALIGAIGLVGSVLAQNAPQGAPGRGGAGRGGAAQAGPPPSEEYLLLGDASRGAGEPVIAVSPVDPNIIMAVAMGNRFDVPRDTPKSTITWLAVSRNGGKSWKVSELPILSGDLVRCPDSMIDVTKDGTFLAGCEPVQIANPRYGMSAIVVSSDNGETWGPRSEIISSLSGARYAPGLRPRMLNALPWDRPFTYVDDSTGIIYGQAAGGSTDLGAPPGQFRSQSYITASSDGGYSFGTVYSWDSKDYQQSSRGISMTAGHGEAAVVYIASKVPAKEKATCPCAVMGITKDQGKTFEYHVLKNITPEPPAPAGAPAGGGGRTGTGGLSAISQDFTKAGRYAMLKYSVENGAPQFSVAVSDDHGTTWSPFVVAGTTPGATGFDRQLAFEYGRNGVLAIAWRAAYSDGTYDVWSSISKDGGHGFSQPYRVSRAKSPTGISRGITTQNDDVVDLSMDNNNVHMVWGDSRAGFLGTWYGRVSLSAYKFP
jgi:hypothetical protein